MDCALPEVFAARAGEHAPADPRMLIAPPFLDGRARPRAEGKSVYGQSLTHHIDTENFTVQWDDPAVDEDAAEAIAAALESGWSVLVDEIGWEQPVSTDTYLQWVVLDTSLGGSGYTTTYPSDEYPGGYPVMYVNSAYAADMPAFRRSVAVHEFGHALQFRQRGYGAANEAWFWEATSEWLAETGLPAADTYALSTYWYTQRTEYAFDSMADYHQYGMLLLDAYLDEFVFGAEGIRDVWTMPGDWDAVIGGAAGVDFGELIADMSAAVASGGLRESALYSVPTYYELDGSGEIAGPDRYGTAYARVADGTVVDAGDAIVREVGDGVWTYTARAEGGTLRWGPPVVADTGDTADTGEPEVAEEPDEDEVPTGCGCATGASAPWSALLPLLILARARARPRPPARPRSRRGSPSDGR